MSRNSYIKYIIDKSKKSSNNILDIICENIVSSIDDNPLDENIGKLQKYKYIKENIELVESDKLKEIYNRVKDEYNKEKEYENKCDIVIDIVNSLLENIGEDTICDLCEFQNIDRDRLTNDECKQIVLDKLDYLFENGFDKKTCKYYDRLRTPQYHLSVLRSVLETIGYTLKSVYKNKSNNGKIERHCIYSIIKE